LIQLSRKLNDKIKITKVRMELPDASYVGIPNSRKWLIVQESQTYDYFGDFEIEKVLYKALPETI
jgi:hypothetical protein